MINFAEYDDEKLKCFILAWEYLPTTRILNDINLYKKALREAEKRGLNY